MDVVCIRPGSVESLSHGSATATGDDVPGRQRRPPRRLRDRCSGGRGWFSRVRGERGARHVPIGGVVTTVDQALGLLVSHGFCAMRLGAADPGDGPLVFSFGWDLPFMDVVTVRAEKDATAHRERLDDELDLFGRKNVVWSLDGSFVEVVFELVLELPKPGTPGAPTLIRRTPASLLIPPGAAARTSGSSRLIL